MHFETFPFVARDRALQAFGETVAKLPLQYTTLCEVRRVRTGRLLAYRLQSTQHLIPLPQERGTYCIPIRHA